MNQNSISTLAALVSIVALVVAIGFGVFGGHGNDAATQTEIMALQQSIEQLNVAVEHSGSLASPDIPSPYLNWGGVSHWAAGNVLGNDVVATTTSGSFCAILAPYGTSTVVRASWRPDSVVGIGSTATFDISTSTTVSGSSTPAFVIGASIGSTQSWMQEASSSPAIPTQVLTSVSTTGANNTFTVFSSPANPLFLTFRIATTSGNTGVIPSTMLGNCSAEFTQL